MRCPSPKEIAEIFVVPGRVTGQHGELFAHSRSFLRIAGCQDSSFVRRAYPIMTHQKTLSSKPSGALSARTLPTAVRVRGRDGRLVEIPAGYVANQGRDGRMVAVPSGAGSLEGGDGRLVVIPPGHIGIETAKGRVVPKSRF